MTVSLLSIFFKRAAVQNGLTLFSSFKINVLIYECVWIFKLVYYNGSYLYNTHTETCSKNLTQALMAWNYPPPPNLLLNFTFTYLFSIKCVISFPFPLFFVFVSIYIYCMQSYGNNSLHYVGPILTYYTKVHVTLLQ